MDPTSNLQLILLFIKILLLMADVSNQQEKGD